MRALGRLRVIWLTPGAGLETRIEVKSVVVDWKRTRAWRGKRGRAVRAAVERRAGSMAGWRAGREVRVGEVERTGCRGEVGEGDEAEERSR